MTGPARPDRPMRLSQTPPVLHRAPPTLGEHTDEVLLQMGVELGDIAALRQKGVIA